MKKYFVFLLLFSGCTQNDVNKVSAHGIYYQITIDSNEVPLENQENDTYLPQTETNNEGKYRLNITQSVQENNYFCGPAIAQMALKLFELEMTQETLAIELNTDAITGTEYDDLARVLNKYLFGSEIIGPSDPGYRVRIVSKDESKSQLKEELEKRILQNINDGYPVFIAIDLKTLYPELNNANHFVIVSGYKLNQGSVEYYYIVDPLYTVQDKTYQGLKYFTPEEIVDAIINNIEPAYIW